MMQSLAIDDAIASSHATNYHMEYQSYWTIGTIAQLYLKYLFAQFKVARLTSI